MKILITGVSGFIGGHLSAYLGAQGHQVTGVARSLARQPHRVLGDIDGDTDWGDLLQSPPHVVIHLAATACKSPVIGQGGLRQLNVDATLNLATQAAQFGVRRFVFLSSIKVNGGSSTLGSAFTAADDPQPCDAYAQSKFEAEKGLHQIATKTGLEVVVVRAPLVYGAGVKGNLRAMLKYLRSGYPLPFGKIRENRRSLVGIGNLVDLLHICTSHPKAANQTFLVCDGEDLSTFDLLSRLGRFMGCPANLWNFPESLLYLLSKLTNTTHVYDRLCGSLQVDMTKTCDILGWSPPFSVDRGLKATVGGDGLDSLL